MTAGRTQIGAARLFALVLTILLGLAPAHQALAHASLISSQPEDGAVLESAPERVILIFNEPVKPLRMQVVGAAGQAVPLTDIVQHDNSVILRMPAELARGTHALSWRVVSADGHPVGGTLIFSVGEESAGGPELQTQSDASVWGAIWALRTVIFISLFFGLGGAVFAGAIARHPLPKRKARQIGVLCAAGLVAIPLSVGLQGLDALQLPLAALTQAAAWSAGFATSYGTTAVLIVLALVLGLLSLQGRAAPVLLALGALAAAGSALAASGHAAAAAPEWLTRPAVWLHAVAVVVWIGSLWPLAFLLRADEIGDALLRFSRVIPFFIVALLISGGLLAVIQLARLDALWTTNYGWILSLKLALVALLLVLATVNRYRFTRKVAEGDAVARRRLRRSIAAEIALALLIFALVAGWRFTPPPRSVVSEEQSEFIHFHAATAMADLTLTSGRVGRSSAEIVVRDGDFQPMMPKGVTLIVSQPAGGIEPLQREAVSIGDNRWRIDEVTLPAPGRWRFRLEILIDDFTKVAIEDEVRIRR